MKSILVMLFAVFLAGCSQLDINNLHLNKSQGAFNVQGFPMADDSFKVVSTDKAGNQIIGKAVAYNEYGHPLFEKNLKSGAIRFDYPMSYSFVRVKVISDTGEESENKFWRTQTLSASSR